MSVEERVRCNKLKDKIMSPEEAAAFVHAGDTLGVSGFTQSGYTKVVAGELAKRAEAGEDLRLTVYTGASVGDAFDGVLTRAGALERRMPYQTNKDLRNAINAGQIKYTDIPLSQVARWVRNGYLNHINVAIIEAVLIDEEGNIVPTTSVGASETYVQCADKVIVEINTRVPEALAGIHDIYSCKDYPNVEPINITKVNDRIGKPYIACDPDKIVAIVESDVLDGGVTEAVMDDEFRAMSDHLIGFLNKEVEAGRMPNPLPPLQAGIGAVSNAVLEGLVDSSFEHLTIYSEVMQQSMLDLITAGKIDGASATSIAVPANKLQDLYDKIDQYKDKVVLRPMEISNSAEVIHRLNVIAINTVIEADIYGNVNSTYVGGNRLMNGVGGSGDFCQNAGTSIFISKSTAKNGAISSIMPMVSHIDHDVKKVMVLITEQGVADLRGLTMLERAEAIIENCAHPKFRQQLRDYLKNAAEGTNYPAYPYNVELAHQYRRSMS